MASSILSSGTGGRIITIRPESGAQRDVLDEQDVGGDEFQCDHEGQPEASGPWDRKSHFSSSPFSGFNRTSEALELWESIADVRDLPTQTRKYELVKRSFDVVLAILIFPIVGAMLLAISAIIALTSDGPIFFRQRRIGQHGREFFIWKFRTMNMHAERILAEHLRHDPVAREEWRRTHKLRNDPRITRMGRFLRKTSLDELPQILNVLSGDMSFVGPRPIVRAETSKYAERYAYYLAAVPGITGLWQVSGRCNVSYEARVILDETYVCKWSLARDIWILLRTPRAVCCRDGAY